MHLLTIQPFLVRMSSKRLVLRVKRMVLVSRTTSSASPLVSFVTPLWTPVLVDSGADESFMDWKFTKRLKLKILPMPEPSALPSHSPHLTHPARRQGSLRADELPPLQLASSSPHPGPPLTDPTQAAPGLVHRKGIGMGKGMLTHLFSLCFIS